MRMEKDGRNMRIVITGTNSYIGDNICSYIQNANEEFEVCMLDVIGKKWREFDFSGYDAVVHVAAIVHRKDNVSWEEYYKVNAELPEEIAKRAKSMGVKQFVFFSSMAIYGVEKTLSPEKSVVSDKTVPNPSSMYGKSKYLAEQKLLELEDDNFKIAIIRPPNVYGPGCRGRYIQTYKNIVLKLPIIPKAFTFVRQSVLYIDNLSRFVYLLITDKKNGVYMPQDEFPLSAVEIMRYISEALNLNKKTSAFFGTFMYLFSFCSLVRKGYGGICYDSKQSHHGEFDYLIVSSKEGIERTVLYGDKCYNTGL